MSKNDFKDDAKKWASNWKKFQSFCWYDKPDSPENWLIYYTSTRDSDLLEKCNEIEINKALEKFEDDVVFERHSCWAHGYRDGFSLRVFSDNGNITQAFKEFCQLLQSLDEYPILNEEAFSDMTLEETFASIAENKPDFDNQPEDLDYQIYKWLSDNKSEILEMSDGWPYVSEDDCKLACDGLGFKYND